MNFAHPDLIGHESNDLIVTYCADDTGPLGEPIYDESAVSILDSCTEDGFVTYEVTVLNEFDCQVSGVLRTLQLEWKGYDDCGNVDSIWR